MPIWVQCDRDPLGHLLYSAHLGEIWDSLPGQLELVNYYSCNRGWSTALLELHKEGLVKDNSCTVAGSCQLP